jgi:lipopolysaccharide export system protein LptA
MLLAAALAANAEKTLPAGGNSKAPIEITADALEVFQAEQRAIFSGNVIAKQGTMTVKSDKMTVYYKDNNSAKDSGKAAGDVGNSISKIELNGDVFLTTPMEAARAKKGFYDTKSNFVSLEGDVVLTREGNVLKGNKLDFDVNSGHSKLVSDGSSTGGRVSGLLTPSNK